MAQNFRIAALALSSLACSAGYAGGLGAVRFVVVDPVTRQPVTGKVIVQDELGHNVQLLTSIVQPGTTPVLDTRNFLVRRSGGASTTVTIPLGTTVTLVQQQEVPVKEITIRVTASRIKPNQAPTTSNGTNRDRNEITKFVNTTNADTKALTKGQSGVAEDSAGQQHVRGEHAEIAYVIDGVMLPDTLSGRQGSVVVPSTIENLEIITGGFAPEFGGQTAAILNISTLPNVKRARTDMTIQGGSYGTLNGDLTSVGPLGLNANYVINLNATRTNNAVEPQQPDKQTAHNGGSSRNIFSKLRVSPNSRDAYTITISHNPDQLQIGNRTGLDSSFAAAGQGYGFLGMRNADGTRPDVTPDTAGLLGAQKILLRSQDQELQDINQHEVSEFATLNFQRKISKTESAQLAVTMLHSGQEVTNNNPLVDPFNLPVDNSIEYNPSAYRNVHHVQMAGSYNSALGGHKVKAGFLLDAQTGNESYRIEAGSQLALDALAATAPNLAPAGTTNGQMDVNGNPVFTPSGAVPTLKVKRVGTYKAAYVQDTWAVGRLTVNYGLRGDWYSQNQDLGQPSVNTFELSPRLNFQYKLNQKTNLRWAYNHLFNTPPLAQGAVVGQAIQPETLDQYEVSIEHKVRPNQTLSLAYYYKNIKNQVDTGLLIPGSQIGLYSAVNLAKGGVHGVEFSYDISAPKGVGWDTYFNYSFSAAKPNGKDNAGGDVPDFNDHDQRQTLGVGAAYTWASGATAALTFQHGSGLASSIVAPSLDRTPRSELDLRFNTGDRLFHGNGGIALDISNLLDTRTVINFQSGFSGTRFQQGRRILISASYHF